MTTGRELWGPWASLFFTLLVWVAYNLIALGLGMLFVRMDWLGAAETPEVLTYSGQFLAVTVLVNAVLCTLLVLSFIALRRGLSLRDYLALYWPGQRLVLWWLALLLPFLLVSEILNFILERPLVPDFIVTAYSTAEHVWLLWIGVVIAAPIFEEILFRGFLQKGITQSHFGVTGGILAPALLWTAIHLQYDLYDLTWVFIFGVLLGVARWRTGSLAVPLAMHMMMNLIALIVTAALVAQTGS